jgi:outer membrane protein assembly factor BamA
MWTGPCAAPSINRANTAVGQRATSIWCVSCTVPRVPTSPSRATRLLTLGLSLVHHAPNRCRGRGAAAARVTGSANPASWASTASLLVLVLLVSACATIPARRYATEAISVTGNGAIDSQDILDHIATRATPRFFGLFQGVMYDYEVFDRYVLERDLQRIERYYRSRGFYRCHVRAGRVFNSGRQKVSIEIVVEEGPPTLVGRVDVHGVEGVSAQVLEEADSAIKKPLDVGDRFEEEPFDQAAQDLKRIFADSGHAYVKIKRAADVDLTRDLASLGYWVDPGPVVHLGKIDIQGLGNLPEDQIRNTMRIEPGDLYSQTELEDAERALLDLGVFSAASIKPDLEHRASARATDVAGSGNDAEATGEGATDVVQTVPIHVVLEQSRFRSLHLGGGLQVDSQRTDVHLVAGWEHRNLFGGLRSFLVEFVPGAVIYPTRLPDLEAPERLLPEARLRFEFRQPNFIEAITAGVIRAQASVSPVLLSSERDPAAPVLGYRDVRASAGLERSIYWKLFGSISQNVQVNDPFAYAGELGAALGTVIVSYPELLLRLDVRDDRLEPKKGVYAATTLQFAGLGGDARDVKIQPEVRLYVPLGGRYNFATRGSFGLLHAANYGDSIVDNAVNQTVAQDDPAVVRDIQLMYLRGFFAGGPGSNRGYGLRDIGPHGEVPFYNPEQTTAECTGANRSSPNCRLPLGGFTLWEASAEFRFPLLGSLRGAVFADAADVSPYDVDFRFDRPHLSAGLGFRYATPVGPVRLDVGYRIPGLQAPSGPDEYEPGEIVGLPIAVSFGIGEPF